MCCRLISGMKRGRMEIMLVVIEGEYSNFLNFCVLVLVVGGCVSVLIDGIWFFVIFVSL